MAMTMVMVMVMIVTVTEHEHGNYCNDIEDDNGDKDGNVMAEIAKINRTKHSAL